MPGEDGSGAERQAQVETALRDTIASTAWDITGSPAQLARGLDPDFRIRPHTRVMSQAITSLEPDAPDHCNRVMILVPPQSGKSTVVEWGVFWWLIRHPSHRVIIASYSSDLAMLRSRTVRELVREHGHMFGLRLSRWSSSVSTWDLETGGGARAAALGGSITGFSADCVSAGTSIITPDRVVPVEQFISDGCPSDVLSYNHDTDEYEWRPVEAAREVLGRTLVEVETAAGRTLRCTPDHRIYTRNRGYVPAEALREGDDLVCTMRGGGAPKAVPGEEVCEDVLFQGVPQRGSGPDADAEMPGVRNMVLPEGGGEPLLLPGLLETVVDPQLGMRAMRSGVRASTVQPEGRREGVLLQGVQQPTHIRRGGPPGATVQNVRHARLEGEDVLQRGLPQSRVPGDVDVRLVPRKLHEGTGRARQEDAPGGEGHDVLHGLRWVVKRGHLRASVSPVQHDHAEGAHLLVLLRRLPVSGPPAQPERGETAGVENVRTVQRDVQAQELPPYILHAFMRECSALGSDARSGQLALPGWLQQGERVSRRETVDQTARPEPMRRLWGARGVSQGQRTRGLDDGPLASGAPYRRESEGEPPAQPDHSVSNVPQDAPHVGSDTVSVVRRVRGAGHRVYDLQVEGNRNFVAGGILVHNCMVLDDYHRGRAEADSSRMRDIVWDWWSSVGKTRLQPDASVVIPCTPWHPDDLRGRLLHTEGRVEDGGRWNVVHMPAIADPQRFGPDPIGRAEGDPLSHPKIPSGDRDALLAHWAERRGDHMRHVPSSVTRDWHALHQGDPQPVGDGLASDDLLTELHQPHHPAGIHRPAVSVDPSGGGRDLAGIIAGYLGDDGRLWLTHDHSVEGDSDTWSRRVAALAADVDATIVYVESNYGGDMATLVVRTAWEKLQRDGHIPAGRLMPRVKAVHSRKGKLLRAEPVAQQMAMDKIRFAALRNGPLEKLAREWVEWRPTDTMSPGRIDASVHLAFGLLPMPQQAATVGSSARVSLREYGIRR